MKLLLTDSGVSNASILAALVDLLGRPIAEARALCIPTAGYGGPYGDPDGPWSFISGQSDSPMTELGWKSVGVLELTALPSINKERWVSWVRESDVLLVNGGDTLYLCHWMQESGLADFFPSLRDTVYVGLSAGSLVLTPRVGEHFANPNPRADGDDSTLGLVDFSIFPHLDSLDRTMAEAEQWAAGIKGPAYAIDSQTAIKVTDGSVEVISEGHWKLFNAAVLRSATLLSRAKSLPSFPSVRTFRGTPSAGTSGSRVNACSSVQYIAWLRSVAVYAVKLGSGKPSRPSARGTSSFNRRGTAPSPRSLEGGPTVVWLMAQRLG